MVGKVLIGCSGWSYDDWKGVFYPSGLKQGDFFTYYSQIFYTNEINTTFYQIPVKWMVKGWVEKSPEDFVFSAKIPRIITHKNKLDIRECWQELEVYLDVMEPLIEAEKMIAFLIQLPPSFNKEDHFPNLKEFIESWPTNYLKESYNLVVEFRNKSWMNEEVFKYLQDKQLTYCGVIEPLLPPRMDVTNSKLSYIRFHGFGKKPWFDYLFSEDQIQSYAEKIKEVIPKVDKIGIYFNNHFSGYAPKNSLMMMKKLDMKPKKSPDQIDLLKIKKKSGEISKDQTSLDKFLK
jgi:uncharacterized protein YecE (DUF72 family)